MGASNKTITKASTTNIVSSSFESISSGFSSWSFVDVTDLHKGFNPHNNPSLFLHPYVTIKMTRKTGLDTRYFHKSRTGRRYHFLDACYLCKRTICRKHDIFMFRGDIPFCSGECREEQMEMDMALERIHQVQNEEKKQVLISFNQREYFTDDGSTLNSGNKDLQNFRENTAIVAR